MKYIDIHCHINFSDYDNDLDKVINRAIENDIGIIIVGTDTKTSKRAVEIAEKYKTKLLGIGWISVDNSSLTRQRNVSNIPARRPNQMDRRTV